MVLIFLQAALLVLPKKIRWTDLSQFLFFLCFKNKTALLEMPSALQVSMDPSATFYFLLDHNFLFNL
jgi:hypothetical protein